jgi:hypothetical protein
MKTLVIILGETRAHELTFDNFKKNVIDVLNADLCLCIGVKLDYDYYNPFYKLAKYKFLYNEDEDYSGAFDYAYNIIINENKIENENHLHWREFLKIKNQFMGGIRDKDNEHPGSGAIQIFYRWFLLKYLIYHKLIDKYDRFVITRSDYIYQLPFPKVERMNSNNIWIPNFEYWGGYTDKNVILSKTNIIPYLNILNMMVLKSNEYFSKMKNYNYWNIEQLIKFHLYQNNVEYLIKEFPYIMYACRNHNGTTRWNVGTYNEKLGYYLKSEDEYNKSIDYLNKFNNSGLTIDEFYKDLYEQS